MEEFFEIEEYKQSYLSQKRLDFLYDKNWFKMFVPKDYNGLELNLTEGAKILTRAATIQGGLGWTLNLGAGANWFSGFFADSIAKSLFSSPKAVIAGSGFASGTYEAKDTKVILNGKWSRCTGAAHASLFSLNGKSEKGKITSFVVPREQVKLSDDEWPIFGLKNSSSHTIELSKVEIPMEYGFHINTIKNHEDYDVFHIPFDSFARVCMSSSFIGIVKCLIRLIEDELLQKKPELAKDIQKILKLILKSEATRNDLSEELSYLSYNKEINSTFESQLRRQLGENNELLFELVQQIFFKGGLPFVEEDQLIHWAYRDVLTGVQHYMVKS
jgi:alkylation response protein AidB-like acyl-CoA dehydrogenase